MYILIYNNMEFAMYAELLDFFRAAGNASGYINISIIPELLRFLKYPLKRANLSCTGRGLKCNLVHARRAFRRPACKRGGWGKFSALRPRLFFSGPPKKSRRAASRLPGFQA